MRLPAASQIFAFVPSVVNAFQLSSIVTAPSEQRSRPTLSGLPHRRAATLRLSAAVKERPASTDGAEDERAVRGSESLEGYLDGSALRRKTARAVFPSSPDSTPYRSSSTRPSSSGGTPSSTQRTTPSAIAFRRASRNRNQRPTSARPPENDPEDDSYLDDESEGPAADEERELLTTVQKQLLESVPSGGEGDEDLQLIARNATPADTMVGGDKGREEDIGLPLFYDPEAINQYWDRRPKQVRRRLVQVLNEATPFALRVLVDWRRGRLDDENIKKKRAVQFRELLTRLGPTFIKLGQALSIRPDLVNPTAMYELQQLCDAVPSFPNAIARKTIEEELEAPTDEIFEDFNDPIAAASLGQVYRCRLKATGQLVAVKVQRPDMLRAVSLDLYLLRKLSMLLGSIQSRFTKQRTDFLGLLSVWATGTYNELDYVNEGQNAIKFERQITHLDGIYIPRVYEQYTSRKVLTTEWIEGKKLADESPEVINKLVKLGVECFLTQLLDMGFFHSDPHPGNLLTTPDGKLVLIDFGLMAEIAKPEMDAMIASIIHLANRDYDKVVDDFVKLDFLPADIDKDKVRPALAAILDQALQGGGAKSINFQSLSAELAEVTFDFPFSIPPYFALIIRALGVLEGIALTGNPEFKLIMEAYPYVSRRVITDASPVLQTALTEILYKNGEFSPTRLNVLLNSAQGLMAEGDAFVDFDTLPDSTMALPDVLDFVFSPEAGFVRDALVEEVSKAVEMSGRKVTNLLADRLIDSLSPIPPLLRPPLLVPSLSTLQTLTEVDTKEQRYLSGVVELAQMAIDQSGVLVGGGGASRQSMSREDLARLRDILRRPQTQEFAMRVGERLQQRIVRRLQQRLLNEIAPPREEADKAAVR
ncbi:unnamed protein product [Vitrella brassicaformis CCMP3155]|uniref:Protein kinase domain-containing protein n=2 Tax=Vitrella brassicaformis TaxID=1169539 RepID=A0A0G4EYC8_VITBC|nr:unnamed protein product [Vitrella brassicaformis CCMP3155]|mmetsp:Transcript_47917/g.119872  ORF Transcript_47917/g.119872 Transcript_47917/m.119872 type:complete len:875 (+) Transcript_47917:46-2670(+)|eukprot:CEM03639.1 unnamed protein product [Vitrella brassicaformis CCMP3155]